VHATETRPSHLTYVYEIGTEKKTKSEPESESDISSRVHALNVIRAVRVCSLSRSLLLLSPVTLSHAMCMICRYFDQVCSHTAVSPSQLRSHTHLIDVLEIGDIFAIVQALAAALKGFRHSKWYEFPCCEYSTLTNVFPDLRAVRNSSLMALSSVMQRATRAQLR